MIPIKYLLAILICTTSCQSGFCQQQRNEKLRKELSAIYADDQRYRDNMALQPGPSRDSIANSLGIAPDNVDEYFGQLQNTLDSINLQKVEHIFKKYGYPGKSLVGEPENEAAYYVIQHSDVIDKYFPLIEKAGEQKEISFLLVAMMQDRLLKSKGQEQLYGTQFADVGVKDSVTQEHRIDWFLWPVKDYKSVSDRRKKAGFKETIEENAESQGIQFRVITIEEAKKKYPGFFPANRK